MIQERSQEPRTVGGPAQQEKGLSPAASRRSSAMGGDFGPPEK